MVRALSVLITTVLFFGITAPFAGADEIVGIRQVRSMPNIPSPCDIRDWKQVAIGLDQLMFDPDAKGQYMPLIRYSRDENQNVVGFGFPDYVGDFRMKPGANGVGAGITDLGAVWGATLVGIDKSKQNYNYVRMCAEHFDARPDFQMAGNDAHSCDPEKTFWYTLFPNIIFASVADRYPNEAELSDMAQNAAVSWAKATDALTAPGSDGVPNYDHTGFDFNAMKPTDNGHWSEPDAGAGVAWIEYAAYCRWHDPKSLSAADACMRYLDQRPVDRNPFYEILMPFGAITAVRMNAELGKTYDADKMINWCFDRSYARPDWKVNTAKWGGIDTAGLVGGTDVLPWRSGKGGYGFTMNTFGWAWALVPIARYDPRYAHDIGKWMLNAASAARLYYANAHSRENQSCPDWDGDPKHVVAYEGLKYQWDDPDQPLLATGDPIHEHWGPKTDYGLYGSVFVGVFGGIMQRTSDDQILRLDLLATDACRPAAYPSYLYYNPHPSEKSVTLDAGSQPVDVYDAVSGQFVSRGVSGSATIAIPADAARVIVLTPAGGKLTYDGNKTLVNGVVVDYRRGAP
jgi:hypothetical protein